ncbi:MAG TPA: hypothetical protein DCM44_18925 [Pantoea sp.]|uniref:hypothetical protein n=1 Tax=Pantoea TaxID=53335 RepID=UPI000BB52DDC|nr:MULTISPECIES: hypothetical protein [Pantoea]PNK64249.1 hypothetical protein A6J33_016430 [Pantoea sp. FDAARGOS_194]HAK36388.1 hypothetical protein [Pantoea sp.]
MIIISLRFSGGSTGEEHDIAHIASSIVARASGLFFLPLSFALLHEGEAMMARTGNRCVITEDGQYIAGDELENVVVPGKITYGIGNGWHDG